MAISDRSRFPAYPPDTDPRLRIFLESLRAAIENIVVGDMAIETASFEEEIYVDTIEEYTATAGVTIDSCLIQDGVVSDSGIAQSSVTQHNAALDHGALAGLADDDHSQYALLAGRGGGQTLIGGTAASENLTLQSTSHATRGKIVVSDSLDVNSNSAIGNANIPTSSQMLAVSYSFDGTSSARYGIFGGASVENAAGSGGIYGFFGSANLGTASGTHTGPLAGVTGRTLVSGVSGGGTATTIESLRAEASLTSSATVTTRYGVHVLDTAISSSTLTNQYGLYIDSLTGGGTNYAIYTGAGTVRFGDNVDIIGDLTVSEITTSTGDLTLSPASGVVNVTGALTATTARIGVGHPFAIESGKSFIEMSVGGWAGGYYFKGNAGTDLGGFGSYGSADVLNYHWIGSAYNATTSTRFDLSSVSPVGNGALSLGTTSLRWGAAYMGALTATTAEFSGDVTIGSYSKTSANTLSIITSSVYDSTIHIGEADATYGWNWIYEGSGDNGLHLYRQNGAAAPGTEVVVFDRGTGAATFSGALTATSATFSGDVNLSPNQRVVGRSYPTYSYLGLEEDTAWGSPIVALATISDLYFIIDSNNNQTTAAFYFHKDGNTLATSTYLAKLDESGDLTLTGALTATDGTFSGTITAPEITTAAGDLTLSPAGDVVLDSNVGIGTATPGAKLHILQTAETYSDGIKIVGSSSAISGRIYMASSSLHIDNATAGPGTGLTFKFDGNVGIGTTSPDELLHVDGNIKGNGSATFAGALTATDGTFSGDVTGQYFQCGVYGYRWNETGVRSWLAQASGGNLTIYSGDAAGGVYFNTAVNMGALTATSGTFSDDVKSSGQFKVNQIGEYTADAGVKFNDKIGFYGTTPVAQAASIGKPAGGGTIDTEARDAIDSIIDALGATSGVGITA